MAKKRVLIVDDDKALTGSLKISLEKTGKYEIDIRNQGSQALEAAKAFMPDIILLDLSMPDMDGDAVRNLIEQDPDLGGVPIVFLTASANEEELDKERRGLSGHPLIAKPVSTDKLIRYIERYI